MAVVEGDFLFCRCGTAALIISFLRLCCSCRSPLLPRRVRLLAPHATATRVPPCVAGQANLGGRVCNFCPPRRRGWTHPTRFAGGRGRGRGCVSFRGMRGRSSSDFARIGGPKPRRARPFRATVRSASRPRAPAVGLGECVAHVTVRCRPLHNVCRPRSMRCVSAQACDWGSPGASVGGSARRPRRAAGSRCALGSAATRQHRGTRPGAQARARCVGMRNYRSGITGDGVCGLVADGVAASTGLAPMTRAYA